MKEHDQAQEVAKRAEREVEAMRSHSFQTSLIIPHLVAVHVAAGDIIGAFDRLDRESNHETNDLLKQELIGNSLGKMVEAAETLDPGKVRALLDRVIHRLADLPLAESKCLALIDLARALARSGEVERAMHFARLIGEGPTNVKYDMRDGKSYAMINIAHEQRQAGDIDGARRTLREAYETTKVLKEARGKSGRIMQVADAMIVAGDLNGVLKCVEDAQPGRRYETLTRLGVVQRQAGDQTAARATFRQALEDAEFRKEHRPKSDPFGPRLAENNQDEDALWNARCTMDIVKIEATMGNFEEARKRADSISDPASRAFALSHLAHAQAAAGDAQTALDWSRKLDLPRTDPNLLMQAIIEGIAEYNDQAKGHQPN